MRDSGSERCTMKAVAPRDLETIQRDADSLSPEEQIALANYLLEKATGRRLRTTGNLSEFKGAIRLTEDPIEFQKSIRAEWP